MDAFGAPLLTADRAARDGRDRAALWARLNRLYRVSSQPIQIADLCFSITGVADPDQVLLEMERGIRSSGAEHPRWQPYWAQSWESAFAIGHALAGRELAGMRVLDLGCGLGLAGAVAAARGAHVVLADAAHPSLLFARYNCWPWRSRVRTRCVNWRADELGERFDMIVGADIVYDSGDWPYLDQFWKKHLASGGEVLLGEPSRDNANVLLDFFRQRGWSTSEWRFDMQQRPRPIRMMLLSRAD